jgi:hypothetical protein
VGLAFGSAHDTVAVDCDQLDPEKAARMADIADETLRPCDFVRYGRRPKWLRLYQCSDELRSMKPARELEIFASSGQVALFGIHPATHEPYQWPDESPLTAGPSALPEIAADDITDYVAALQEEGLLTRRTHTGGHGNGGGGGGGGGEHTGVLRVAGEALSAPGRSVQQGIEDLLTTAPCRHDALLGLVGQLTRLGYSPEAIEAAVAPIWIQVAGSKRMAELQRAVAWWRGGA